MIWKKFNLFLLFRVLILYSIVISTGCGVRQTVSEYIGGVDNTTPPTPLINFIETADLNKIWAQDIGKGTDDSFAKIKPVISGNQIFIADTRGNVAALTMEAGKFIWRSDSRLPITGGPGVGASLVVVGTSEGEILALSKETGNEVWRTKVSSEVLSSPGEADGVVIARTIDGKIFSSQYNILLIFASILIISGVSFKIASFPFLSWVPDVYQGAPTFITMYLSVVSKIAGFSILIRILFQALNSSSYEGWSMFIAIMSLISMIIGNIMALRQRNIKRLFAYSTIAHAGYILIGIASIQSSGSLENSIIGVQATIFYLAGYAITNLTAFISILYITDKISSNSIDDFKGVGFKFKSQGIILAISLISLLGIPPTIGFMGKAFVFSAAITNGFFWLSMAGIINSLISAYYYIKVIKVMFVDISPDYEIVAKTDNIYALAITYLGVIIIFAIGVAPAFLLNLLESVVNTLL